jgi:Uma2 family endonuclease
MDTAARNSQFLDADAFLRTDQSTFANAERYELVHGAIVAHAAPPPEHGVIPSNLSYELNGRLRSHPECRSEVGSGAAPQYEQGVKLALYARSGIPEVWIVNLTAEEVEIYKSPVADGYASVARAGRSDVLTIKAIPNVRIPVAKIFA